MSNIRGVGKDVQHLRSRRLRSSVDSMKEKSNRSWAWVSLIFGIYSISKMFLLSRMADPYSKKKQTRETGVTWAGLQFQSSFQQLMRSNWESISHSYQNMLAWTAQKKKGGGTVGMGETLVKNSMTTPNGDSREGKFPKNGRFFGIFSAVFCVCCLSKKKMAVFIKGRVKKKTNQ